MALDIYAGPLCRYHAGDWENVGQRAAREEGVPYVLAGPDTRDGEPLTMQEIQTAVTVWRDSVADFFKENEDLQFTWPEDPKLEYYTDRPGWPGYYGLLLAAARPAGEPLPDELPEELSDDAEFAAAYEDWEESAFPHVIKPELWLPIRENLVFDTGYLTRDSMSVGTLQGLVFQLRGLNESRWDMDARALDEWSYNQPEPEADVDTHARYGLAVFMRAAEWAMLNNLPLILDY